MELEVVVELGLPRCLVPVRSVKMMQKTLSKPTRLVPFGSLPGQSNPDNLPRNHECVDAGHMPQV